MKLFWPQNVTFEQAMTSFQQRPLRAPFDKEILDFVQSLSKRFVKMRHFPEIVALGYWLRKSNMQLLHDEWIKQNEHGIVRARGTVFHIAPSNVDTIFVYSWLLSLLAGNRNLIRISTKDQQGIHTLLQVIVEELALAQFENIAQSTMICTYGHEEKMTEWLSLNCHTRVIWGGDETIKAIRNIPLLPLANELTFPDRFSLAVLSAEAILNVDSLHVLAEQFYNDVFWFDQMGCSSPRLVVWVGTTQQIAEAAALFWKSLENIILQKKYQSEAAVQVLKYTTALWLATEEQVSQVYTNRYFSRVKLTQVDESVREKHCGGGLFLEYEAANLLDIAPLVTDKDQTLTYFGFTHEELRQLVQCVASRGLDRIVPVGQGLNFHHIWDGQNFLRSFTRIVTVT